MRPVVFALLAFSVACGGRETAERATTSTSTSTSAVFTTATTTFTTATSCSGPCACGERPCPWPACVTPADVFEYGTPPDASFICVPNGATCAPIECLNADGSVPLGILCALDAGLVDSCDAGDVAGPVQRCNPDEECTQAPDSGYACCDPTLGYCLTRQSNVSYYCQ